jgi:hypothetical protein
MEPSELNRDIKRLNSDIKKKLTIGGAEYYDYIENVAKKEFNRIYRADDHFLYMNRKSILIMLRLNIRHRFVALHMFGIYIEL